MRLGLVIITLVMVMAYSIPVSAEDAPDFPELNEKAIKAIKNGLRYLSQNQDKVSGSYGSGNYRIAETAMTGMAFLSQGHTPNEGKYSKNVKGIVKYFIKSCAPSGYIAEGGSRMYEHGFATLFMAEVYGMSRDQEELRKIKDVLTKSMGLLQRAQCSAGGWDYAPSPTNRSDISITVCQAMAMRASRAGGIKISPETVEKTIECLRQAANPDGGFKYTLPGGGGSALPRSAGGMCIAYALGLYNNPKFADIMKRGIDYLANNLKAGGGGYSYTFYTTYYASHAMYQAGGKYWKEWYPGMRDKLLSMQSPNGSWTGGEGGIYFGTGIACIVLQIPFRYLPIVQR